MTSRNRDTQRQRLYRAEGVLRDLRVSKIAKKHLTDTQRHSWLYERDENGKSGAVKYPSVDAAQCYVNAICEQRWFQSRWGRRSFSVQAGNGSRAGGVIITLSALHRRSEAVILHELAHCLTPHPYAWHGPEFAGILLTLVRNVMGKEWANTLRRSFGQYNVKVSMKATPQPGTKTVVSKTQQAAKIKTREQAWNTMPSKRSEAAAIIRASVKAGVFGPSGSKPRVHALATARALEKGDQ